MEVQLELCKYCCKNKAIRNSHEIPFAVWNWLKKTSSTGYLRDSIQPNIRRQDGVKSPLLCTKCEKKISRVEDFFIKHYFNKVANYRVPCPNNLIVKNPILECIHIIAWRVLANTYYCPTETNFSKEEFNKIPYFMSEIKKCIDSHIFLQFKIHFIPCTKKVLERLNLPKVEFHIYERSITADPRIWDNYERFIIFIQIPFNIIVFEVIPNNKDPWVGTMIDERQILNLDDIKSVPEYLSMLIKHYYENFLQSRNKITSKQMKIMKLDIENADPNCGSIKSARKSW